jgi:hypothetical protein
MRAKKVRGVLSLSSRGSAVTVGLSGPSETVYRIDTSSNLSTWTPLLYLTNYISYYAPSFTDPVSNAPARLYRAVGQ